MVKPQMMAALDALVDLQYVLLGTAHLMGFNTDAKIVKQVQETPDEMPKPWSFVVNRFEEAWDRVQKANMTKVRTKNPADSKRKSEYDVVKPEGWEPPQLHDLV